MLKNQCFKMPNPYDHLFGSEQHQEPLPDDASAADDFSELKPPENQQDPLDAILEKIALFQQDAEAFSILLSRTRAVDHEVPNELLTLFIKSGASHDQGSLAAEKAYHEALTKKFRQLIEPMKALAQLHLETIRQFNTEIDEGYFSIEKEAAEVKTDKTRAVDGLNFQRKILAEAAHSLDILDHALQACERRMKQYVNAGGVNNLSAAELALIAKNREQLTIGREHAFDYTFFSMNLIDKTAITLGFYMKETSAQYLQKLMHAFEHRK